MFVRLLELDMKHYLAVLVPHDHGGWRALPGFSRLSR
jgi:hypothetical protein